jgi:hypothetical protein
MTIEFACQNFAGTSPEFAITWAIDLWFQIRKVQEWQYGKGNSPVTSDWLQVHRKSCSPDKKQWQDFSDRLRRLQIDFQHDSFSYGYVLDFSRSARGLIWWEDFGKGVVVARGTGDGGGTRVVARVWFWGEIGMEEHGGGAPELI